MGYDNNNAGMHMIRWDRDTLGYKLPDPYFYERTLNQKKYAQRTPEEKEILRKKLKGEPMMFDYEMNRDPVEPVARPQEPTTTQKKKKKHYHHAEQRQYGTELVVPNENFKNMDLIERNVMSIAIKKKLDIDKLIAEAEDLMVRDKRTNPKEFDWNNLYSCPRLTLDLVFLDILASKMECHISDFFVENEEFFRDVAYSILRSVRVDSWFHYYKDPDGTASIDIPGYDYISGMTEGFPYNFETITRTMDLELSKRKLQDGTFWYTLYFGKQYRERTPFDFTSQGACIFEEDLGYLKDYMEKVLVECADEFEEW